MFDVLEEALKLARQVESDCNTTIPYYLITYFERKLQDAYKKGQYDKVDEIYNMQRKQVGKTLSSIVESVNR